MKTKQRINPKKSESQQSRSRPSASTSSSSIGQGIYTKETQSTSSLRPSLLERMKPQSLQERLSSPTFQCSTIGTGSEPLVTQTSNKKRPKRRSRTRKPTEKGTNEPKETMKTDMTTSAMNRFIDGQRSTQSSSPGPCQTGWKAAHCEMSAPQPGIS